VELPQRGRDEPVFAGEPALLERFVHCSDKTGSDLAQVGGAAVQGGQAFAEPQKIRFHVPGGFTKAAREGRQLNGERLRREDIGCGCCAATRACRTIAQSATDRSRLDDGLEPVPERAIPILN
jgi:hypothetical protein